MGSVPTGLVMVAAAALGLAGAGLLLWQWATGRQARQATGRHLAQRIDASLLPEATGAAGRDRNAGTAAAVAPGLTDPWLHADDGTAAAPKGRLETLLPIWLEGAVSPTLLALGACAIVLLTALAGLFMGWLAAAAAFIVLLLAGIFVVWWRVQKFRRQLVSQLPGFIDAMVRLITIGNSTQAAFQLAIPTTQAPLRGYLDRAAGLVRAGVDLDRALHQTAESVRIEEMFLLAAILGLGVRYGGRADLLLERVAAFMRDREAAEHELIALSSETRLSAWILGLLPVSVGGAMIMMNPGYFLRMWQDPTGQTLIFVGAGLQVFGSILLYRLARI